MTASTSARQRLCYSVLAGCVRGNESDGLRFFARQSHDASSHLIVCQNVWKSGIKIKKLTHGISVAMLLMHSQKTSAGIRAPEYKGQKAAFIIAVFLCPSKIHTALVRLKSVLVGCIGQLSSWPAPLSGSPNPMQPATQSLGPFGGGYILNKGDTAMVNHTQKPAHLLSLQSRFNLISETGFILARSIPFQTAQQIKAGRPNCKIKFDRMVIGGAA